VSDEKKGMLERIIVPILVGLISGAFTGYMGAYTAIAVLEEKVNKLESRQDVIRTQQELDGRAMVRIETKVDLLLARTGQ
jgi:hypothetical protein